MNHEETSSTFRLTSRNGLQVEATSELVTGGVRTTVTIDGDLYESEVEKTTMVHRNAVYSCMSVLAMMDAGMIRKVVGGWELAMNAEFPVPANYKPEWKEDYQ